MSLNGLIYESLQGNCLDSRVVQKWMLKGEDSVDTKGLCEGTCG